MEQKTYDQVVQALDFLHSVAREHRQDKPIDLYEFALFRVAGMIDVHWMPGAYSKNMEEQ